MTTLVRPAPVRRSFAVRAPIARAFETFFARMNDWSPATHSLGGNRRALTIEPFPGGRWYETSETGAECDWGRVVEWDPPHRALLLWQIGSDFRYHADVETEVEVVFTPIDDATTAVHFEHRALENLGGDAEAGRAILDDERGWGGALRAYAARAEGRGA